MITAKCNYFNSNVYNTFRTNNEPLKQVKKHQGTPC